MTTKKTILSEKELNLIETLLANYGAIITFAQIYHELEGKISRQSVRNLVNKLVKNGWLVSIKKGTYAISSLESRGFATLPVFKIAQTLVENSYVSFEAALQYHGMFNQHLRVITSVSLNKYKAKTIQGLDYRFIHVKKDLFYGWVEGRVENYLVKIATAEKAIIDFMSFNRTSYSIDLILEKLKEHKSDFDFQLFNKHVKVQTITVKRILGFLFDYLSIDSTYLYDFVKNEKSSSRMTKNSNRFNAKWRLYYEDKFIK